MDEKLSKEEMLLNITKTFNIMCKRIEEDPDNVQVSIEGTHDATELDEIDGIRQFIEGNRGLTISVKENRPRSYYTNKLPPKIDDDRD